jgi:branched-chain amino acid transport system substrate-binding protein
MVIPDRLRLPMISGFSLEAMPDLTRIAILIFGLFAVAGCAGRREAEPILIGHIAPFSGPNKPIGEQAKNAIALAAEEINKEENLIAGRRLLVLHPTHAGDDLDTLGPLAVRLIAVQKVAAVLGGETTTEVDRLSKAARPYGVPLITPAQLAADGVPDVYSLNMSLSRQGTILAKFAAEELHAVRAMVLTDSRLPALATVSEAFSKEFTKRTGTKVAEERIYKSAEESGELARAAAKFGGEAIVYLGASSELARFCRDLREDGVKTPILVGPVAAPLSASGDAQTGLFSVTPYDAEVPTSENRDFVGRYRERFQENPDMHAGLAFDGIRILADALRRAGTPIGLKVGAALADPAFQFQGLTGKFTFDRARLAQRPAFVISVQKDKNRIVKRYDDTE